MTNSLENALGYTFQNRSLLELALVHPSRAYELKTPLQDNQRLEFLGDAVLQLTLTEILYHSYPDYTEGQMTALRSRIVSKEGLTGFAKSIDLASHMVMGKGELAQSGQNRPSTLADGFEALLGAIFLDGGYTEVAAMVKRIIGGAIAEIDQNPEERNPKGKLQEILQEIISESPTYETISEEGPCHAKVFKAQVTWNNKILGSGSGVSKKAAEANAAHEVLRSESWK